MCRVGPAPIDAWAVRDGLGCRERAVARGPADAGAGGSAGWRDPRRGFAVLRNQARRRVAESSAAGAGAGADLVGHLAACAWVAAWLTAREREMLGPRELLVIRLWRGELLGLPGPRELVHRPDLVGIVPGRRPAAVEVELRRKSKARLAGDSQAARAVDRGGKSGRACTCAATRRYASLVLAQAGTGRARPGRTGAFAIELLGTIKRLALEASESVPRGTRLAGRAR